MLVPAIDAVAATLQWGRRLGATERHTFGFVICRVPNSFNGAVAWERRKAPSTMLKEAMDTKASMGPSLGSDGKVGRLGAARVLLAASMGPSLGSDGKPPEDAEPEAPKKLQWGRRLGATESVRKGHSAVAGSDRFNGAVAWERRKEAILADAERSADASMGPSLGSDGKLYAEGSKLYAEGRLQWGRRLGATESPSCRRGGRDTGSFNGAVAWERRKELCTSKGAVMAKELQWGRRLGATERSTSTMSAPPPNMLQWGRRLGATERTHANAASAARVALQWGRRLGATERPLREWILADTLGFNGAVAWERRKGAVVGAATSRLLEASMGPSLGSDGKAQRRAEFPRLVFAASMGPSLGSDGKSPLPLCARPSVSVASMGPSLGSDGKAS